MNEVIDHAIRIIAIGAGATLVMDGWLMFLKRLGVPIQGFNLLGRWIGHWPGGVFRHDSIVDAAPVKGELLLGWLAHYAIGIAFVVILVAVVGPAWLATPTIRSSASWVNTPGSSWPKNRPPNTSPEREITGTAR